MAVEEVRFGVFVGLGVVDGFVCGVVVPLVVHIGKLFQSRRGGDAVGFCGLGPFSFRPLGVLLHRGLQFLRFLQPGVRHHLLLVLGELGVRGKLLPDGLPLLPDGGNARHGRIGFHSGNSCPLLFDRLRP